MSTEAKLLLFRTNGTGIPVCPYCGNGDSEWWDSHPNSSVRVWDMRCRWCEKVYRILMTMIPRFTTSVIS